MQLPRDPLAVLQRLQPVHLTLQPGMLQHHRRLPGEHLRQPHLPLLERPATPPPGQQQRPERLSPGGQRHEQRRPEDPRPHDRLRHPIIHRRVSQGHHPAAADSVPDTDPASVNSSPTIS